MALIIASSVYQHLLYKKEICNEQDFLVQSYGYSSVSHYDSGIWRCCDSLVERPYAGDFWAWRHQLLASSRVADEDVSDIVDVLSCDEATPETAALSALVWEEMESALAELPEVQRDVFIQTEMEGLSLKEIAEKTGVQANTLLSRKHYAVKRLRKRLKDLYSDLGGMAAYPIGII